MKNKHLIFLLLVLTYSFLFFRQDYGWNVISIALLLPLTQWVYQPGTVRNRFWLTMLCGFLISCTGVMMNGSTIAITALLISMAALSTAAVSPGTTVFTSILWTTLSVIGSFFINLVDQYSVDEKMERKPGMWFNPSVIFSTLIPLVLIFLFFGLYRISNGVFDWFAQAIDLEILSIEGLFFILFSGILFYGMIKFSPLLDFFGFEKEFSPEADLTKEGTLFSQSNLFTAGTSSLVMLNILIFLLNFFDFSFLVMGAQLPDGLSWSELVHQGIGSLITSLVLAIVILLFFIRGTVYSHKRFKLLLILAAIWLFQNGIMIILNFWKNQLYIDEFGLTGKRIGVVIYLLLALIGLVIAYFQITRKKSVLYMFRKFGWSTFIVLVSCSLVNWPLFIANYNISRTVNHGKILDAHYLYELGDEVLPLLVTYNIRIQPDVNSNGDYSYRDSRYDLTRRVSYFIEHYETTSWRSRNYGMDKTYDLLISLSQQKKTAIR